ncbi:MAG TPA: glycoside hydrolase family 2 TIM barrel-domain containing protein [Bacteroidales bacterium]|nr:glycoside hydrolase family 2 TIM barrel-domain containing protein [Bacteroidales bacterium]
MRKILPLLLLIFSFTIARSQELQIPLPEHPRPDFMREQWLNLNGQWDFRFDKQDAGENEKWFSNPSFDKKILVPFPWGSKLSGVTDDADIAWYSRKIQVPSDWSGKQVFVVFGASDWKTKVWLDGNLLGEYQGGYTPFEFDLTSFLKPGNTQTLVVKVDDTPHPFKLEGKQGYGEAKGIWQTVYLERRGKLAFRNVHFTPDIDKSVVGVKAYLNSPATADVTMKLNFLSGAQTKPEVIQKVKKGSSEVLFTVPIEKMHLWDLDDPYLYDVNVSLLEKGVETDKVTTYFGMRKIGTMNFYGLNYAYIALNNKPIYLQLTLDQSYHPDGFYTFPSDEFMKNEILNSKKIGLNGNRIHIKVEVPRKLYWADRLGLLIMADVPNSWGEPDEAQKKEWEVAMRGMLNRDYNHPAIFTWVLWNETWGLFTTTNKETKKREYLPETQKWVASMYQIAKELDPTRLVEDNSACNYDHVVTDINSWHAYLPGYKWKEFLDNAVEKTFPGSTWNYIGGNKQGGEPMINSECGNVWGYTGSTGDVDWSWDYHIMMNEMRLHPKVAGWLYTEHHDVINEWNGYYKFDRTNKFTGLEDLVPGMTLNDLHSYVYIATRGELCRSVKPGETVTVPLYASFLTDADNGNQLYLKTELVGWDKLGRYEQYSKGVKTVEYQPYSFRDLEDLSVKMPEKAGLAVLRLTLENAAGKALHHNFVTFVVEGEAAVPEKTSVVTFKPSSFTSAEWSRKQWNVLDGLKVNGAGSGYFEYNVKVPENIDLNAVKGISLIFEASAKQLFGKDRTDAEKMSGDYMRGGGTFDNSRNPNSYPMTDEKKFPSAVKVRVNGQVTGTYFLEDDPADHRGILSWYSQPRDNKLYEAGSYGYLVKTIIPVSAVKNNPSRTLTIRMEVDPSVPGGLAIYGEKFGRYPLDPTIVFDMK